jgi:hypothetical protein
MLVMSLKQIFFYHALFLSNNHSIPTKVTDDMFVTGITPAHALGAFWGSVSTQLKLKKSAGHFFKEASRKHSGLHERGPAALSDKKGDINYYG